MIESSNYLLSILEEKLNSQGTWRTSGNEKESNYKFTTWEKDLRLEVLSPTNLLVYNQINHRSRTYYLTGRNALRLREVYNAAKESGISEIKDLDRLLKSMPPRRRQRERRLPSLPVGSTRFRVNENGDIVENQDYVLNPRPHRRLSLNEDGDIVITG